MSTHEATRKSIMIVEDDENLRVALADNLEDEGYRVDQACCGSEALTVSASAQHDVIVLDIMLPDLDGYAVCRKLRNQGSVSRILMLTARTLEDDLVRGFEAGADDYLAKPYRLRELLARVGALMRRGVSDATESAQGLPTVSIDRRARRVTDRRGRPIELTRTEFDLLVHLLDHAGQALAREAILQDVWGDVIVDPRTVDNFVSSLKRKLGWTPGCGFEFRAVRGIGYRLEIG